MGHFNGYPLRVDPGSTRGGEFVWANQPPQKLFDQLRALAIDPTTAIVQVNHPRQQVLGYFAQFFVDAATAEPYTPTGILGVFAPYGDEFQRRELQLRLRRDRADHRPPDRGRPHVQGAEPAAAGTVPGSAAGAGPGRRRQRRPADSIPGVVETWFTMLDRGHKATGMGTSRHAPPARRRAGLRAHAALRRRGQGRAGRVLARRRDRRRSATHHAITTNAPFIDMTIDGRDDRRHDRQRERHRRRADPRARAELGEGRSPDRLLEQRASSPTMPIPAAQGTDFDDDRARDARRRTLGRRRGRPARRTCSRC